MAAPMNTTHTDGHRPRSFTPLVALQIFSIALILTVFILTLFLIVARAIYDWQPFEVSLVSYSPTYAVATAGACLVLSFLIPELLVETVRKDLKKETHDDLDEDLPFIFVPSTFIRYGLLSVVTIIGLIMAFSGHGFLVYLPFVAVSLGVMVAYFPTESRMHRWLNQR